jgi:hypothetical protein
MFVTNDITDQHQTLRRPRWSIIISNGDSSGRVDVATRSRQSQNTERVGIRDDSEV